MRFLELFQASQPPALDPASYLQFVRTMIAPARIVAIGIAGAAILVAVAVVIASLNGAITWPTVVALPRALMRYLLAGAEAGGGGAGVLWVVCMVRRRLHQRRVVSRS